jgi:hypothetical protein
MIAFAYFNRPTVIEPARSQIVLPAFTLSVPLWAGASTVLAEYPLANDYRFSIKQPIEAFGENIVVAIRWIEDTDIYVRYKFFDHDDAVLNYPIYDGERIGENAVIEIWSVDSLSAPTLEDDYTFYSSVLVFPAGETSGSYCPSCCSSPSSVITLVATAPSELPPDSACNPFCGTLCNTPTPMPTCDCPTTVVDNCEDGRDYNPTIFISPAMLITLGGATKGDGLGKMFYWDAASTATDTGDSATTVIRPSSIGVLAPGRWLQYV